MKLSSHKLLRTILISREASLEDLNSVIESKYGDYRDYFPLASLVVSGYVACEVRSSSGEPYKERLLASILYAKASGETKVNNYHNPNGKVGYKDKIFTMTAKTQLYFDELKAKRNERVFTAIISIVVGVSSALITLAIKSKI
ncbi:hypothetical protein [Vibrio vulnificus]|uniref:hypothetical protein n=1 Tax=Vibrio vulnificus TaxID=672 RepID=UPI00050381B6|nr:hypothetical protein [Vibrio vulnificus]EHK9015047.1 hypothetical protein [Vibrio vulnificus]EHU4994331.1 hypothetical protein [Vibrio vulnificus]ELC9718749.1 hypothetical protein [Vibrio vulnificus]ELS0763792.1 hypothetical protein [Vibrio vulnificus]ELV8609819.1 hypothetical protein [Vibrio vulnificus]